MAARSSPLSLRPYLVAALLDGVDDALTAGRPALVVAGDDRQARDLAADLRTWLHPRPVRFYPSRGVAYESHLAPPPHLVGLRVAALDSLLAAAEQDRGAGEPPVVVVSAVALSEKVPDPALRPHAFTLRKGDLIDLDETAAQLVAAGYERVDQVDDRGQFAIRGGILDVYPATEDHAVRIDLFDIEIESLRHFSTFTQRSLGELESVEIAPAAELAAEHRELAEIAAISDADERPDVAELLPVDRFHALLDLAPADAAVIIAAEEEIAPALADHWQDVCAAFHDADAHHLYIAPDAIQAALDERVQIRLSAISGDQPFEFRAQAADVGARSMKEAEPELETLVRGGYRTVVAFARRGEGERAAYNLARLRAPWLEDDGPDVRDPGTPAADGSLHFAHATLRDGFVAAGLRLAVVPEHRLFRRRRAERTGGQSSSQRRRGRLRSFSELRTGDIIVHEDHGIARFAGFETKTVGAITRDYLELEYAGTDKVFLPVDQLAKITRYVGAGAAHPPLSKLGGKSWETMKSRARRAAQELAGELLNLYAERKRRPGHAFPEDSAWQIDFEARFPYQETADQAEAIESVKADMERAQPMDRLICGDVGYGKTEVALRAAFKAADDGQQVLLLAPTTILAQQHYGTFAERLKDFPFTIDVVSRFRSAKDQRAVVSGFNDGKVDILIGTHRLLGRDVRPKDLGLLIVDEEQRFGVKQKELLRQLKLRVDVIAMSATPIPRTLQMSLAGMRDITVIETPPEGRRPGEDVRRRVRRAAGAPGARAREGARRPGLLPAQPRGVDRRDRRAAARPVPGDALRGRPRTARRAGARDPHDELPARRGGRARRDEHHRVGHRHPAGQHADRRALGHVRPGPALPDPRARGPQPRARLRLPAVPQRSGADRGRDEAPQRAVGLHRARLGLQDRDARPRDPRRRQPARRRAVRPRGRARLRALPARCSTRRCAPPARPTSTTMPSPCGSTSTSTRTFPPTTSRTSRRRSMCTAASRARATSPTSRSCVMSSRIASARFPSRWPTCWPSSRRGSSSARPVRAR